MLERRIAARLRKLGKLGVAASPEHVKRELSRDHKAARKQRSNEYE